MDWLQWIWARRDEIIKVLGIGATCIRDLTMLYSFLGNIVCASTVFFFGTNHSFQSAQGSMAKSMHTQLIEAEKNGRHFADDIFKCIFLNENV